MRSLKVLVCGGVTLISLLLTACGSKEVEENVPAVVVEESTISSDILTEIESSIEMVSEISTTLEVEVNDVVESTEDVIEDTSFCYHYLPDFNDINELAEVRYGAYDGSIDTCVTDYMLQHGLYGSWHTSEVRIVGLDSNTNPHVMLIDLREDNTGDVAFLAVTEDSQCFIGDVENSELLAHTLDTSYGDARVEMFYGTESEVSDNNDIVTFLFNEDTFLVEVRGLNTWYNYPTNMINQTAVTFGFHSFTYELRPEYVLEYYIYNTLGWSENVVVDFPNGSSLLVGRSGDQYKSNTGFALKVILERDGVDYKEVWLTPDGYIADVNDEEAVQNIISIPYDSSKERSRWEEYSEWLFQYQLDYGNVIFED